jgi:hypothetical protein
MAAPGPQAPPGQPQAPPGQPPGRPQAPPGVGTAPGFGQWWHQRYIGPQAALRGKTALVRLSLSPGGAWAPGGWPAGVVAQFDDVSTGYGYGLWAFRRDEFEPIESRPKALHYDPSMAVLLFSTLLPMVLARPSKAPRKARGWRRHVRAAKAAQRKTGPRP